MTDYNENLEKNVLDDEKFIKNLVKSVAQLEILKICWINVKDYLTMDDEVMVTVDIIFYRKNLFYNYSILLSKPFHILTNHSLIY